jgi:hypothetical protein
MKGIKNNNTDSLYRGVCLLVCGVGVGWLIGLSISPVIQYVITSLLAVIVSVASALAGIKVAEDKETAEGESPAKRKLRVEVTPFPLMMMVIGVAVGASFGVYGRTNGWLSPDVNRFVSKWENTGLDKKEISARLFDILYPPSELSARKESKDDREQSGSLKSGNDEESKTSNGENSGEQSKNTNASAATSKAVSAKQEAPSKTNVKKEQSAESASSTSASRELAQKTSSSILFNGIKAPDCVRFRTAARAGDKRLYTDLTNYNGGEEIKKDALKCREDDMECLSAVVSKYCRK